MAAWKFVVLRESPVNHSKNVFPNELHDARRCCISRYRSPVLDFLQHVRVRKAPTRITHEPIKRVDSLPNAIDLLNSHGHYVAKGTLNLNDQLPSSAELDMRTSWFGL